VISFDDIYHIDYRKRAIRRVLMPRRMSRRMPRRMPRRMRRRMKRSLKRLLLPRAKTRRVLLRVASPRRKRRRLKRNLLVSSVGYCDSQVLMYSFSCSC
jgi:hypothetical protein